MVEKPLTISLDDALAIRKIAREKHIQVLVNYETTWYSSNKAAYDEVRAGQARRRRRVVVHDGHQGPKEIGVSPEFLKWLTDPQQNGAGALYDFGCYGVDLMTWLMHGETPMTVTAVVNHDKPEIYPKVDDDSTIVLAVSARAGGDSGLVELAIRAQGHGSVRCDGLRHHGCGQTRCACAMNMTTEEQMTTPPPLARDAEQLAQLSRGSIARTDS